jgi:hypothetical protein
MRHMTPAWLRAGAVVAAIFVAAAVNSSCGGGAPADGGRDDAPVSDGASADAGATDAGPCGGYQQPCCATQPRCSSPYTCTGLGTAPGACLPI